MVRGRGGAFLKTLARIYCRLFHRIRSISCGRRRACRVIAVKYHKRPPLWRIRCACCDSLEVPKDYMHWHLVKHRYLHVMPSLSPQRPRLVTSYCRRRRPSSRGQSSAASSLLIRFDINAINYPMQGANYLNYRCGFLSNANYQIKISRLYNLQWARQWRNNWLLVSSSICCDDQHGFCRSHKQ